MDQPSPRSPYAFGPGEAPAFTFANGNKVEVKVGERQSDGRLTLIEGTHMPHTGPPLHVHDDVDEIFYVLEGNYAITCGERVFDADPGTLVFVPRGTSHKFQPGRDGGRMLLVYTPGGFEGYFEERQRDEAQHGGSLLPDQLDSLGHKYGMRLDCL
jgi:mannose-6-phosphate isomerase-like protein (cupin superfamily)